MTSSHSNTISSSFSISTSSCFSIPYNSTILSAAAAMGDVVVVLALLLFDITHFTFYEEEWTVSTFLEEMLASLSSTSTLRPHMSPLLFPTAKRSRTKRL
jgi:hypothetical protein